MAEERQQADWGNSGFHAIVPEDVVNKIQEAGGDYITVEEDKTMSINSGL